MAASVASLLGLMVVMMVVFPLITSRSSKRGLVNNSSQYLVHQLLEKRDTLIRFLIELKADRNLGKVTETEYKSLRLDAYYQAISTYKLLDPYYTGVLEQIEAEISSFRQQSSSDIESPNKSTGGPL